MTKRIPDEWILRIIGIRSFLENGYSEKIFSRFLVSRLRMGLGLEDLVSIECRLSVLPDGRREPFRRIFLRIAGVSLSRRLHDLGFRAESREAIDNTMEAMSTGKISGLEFDWICEQAGHAEDLARLTRSGDADVFAPTMMDEPVFGCQNGRP